MLLNCQLSRYQVNKSRMLAIANYSRECLKALNQTYSLDYQGRQRGTLQVFRDEKQLTAIEKDMQLLAQSGVRFELLNVAQCLTHEPGLALCRKNWWAAYGCRMTKRAIVTCFANS